MVVSTVFGTGVACDDVDLDNGGTALPFSGPKMNPVLGTFLAPVFQRLENALAVASDFPRQGLCRGGGSAVTQQNCEYGNMNRAMAPATDLVGQCSKWIRHFSHMRVRLVRVRLRLAWPSRGFLFLAAVKRYG